MNSHCYTILLQGLIVEAVKDWLLGLNLICFPGNSYDLNDLMKRLRYQGFVEAYSGKSYFLLVKGIESSSTSSPTWRQNILNYPKHHVLLPPPFKTYYSCA